MREAEKGVSNLVGVAMLLCYCGLRTIVFSVQAAGASVAWRKCSYLLRGMYFVARRIQRRSVNMVRASVLW